MNVIALGTIPGLLKGFEKKIKMRVETLEKFSKRHAM